MTTEIKYLTKKAAIQAVTKNGNELKYCKPELQNNKEVVWEAIKKDSWAFSYASEALRSNKAFVIKAINDGVATWGLLVNSNINIQSDIKVMTLALEKSHSGWEFQFAKGKVAINKELAAKALVKWGEKWGTNDVDLWKSTHHTLQDFFPENCFYEKAQAYLNQLEQEKQAELVSGGSTAEDEVVW